MPAANPAVTAALVQGALMGAGLIVVIGAQNAFVLRQGITRRHVASCVAVCVVSDWILIAAGAFGLGGLIASQPALTQFFRYAGALFLMAYGALALRRAARAGALVASSAAPVGGSRRAAVGTAVALTWLNPHVYLDTVVLLGSVAAQQPGASRAAFAVGAALSSLIWFTALGAGASALAPRLQRPGTWRLIDAGVALVMFGVAWQLLASSPSV